MIFYLCWSLLVGALSHPLSGWRHRGHCLPGQPSLISILESFLAHLLLALYCGDADGGSGDEESPFHKSEQMVKKQNG